MRPALFLVDELPAGGTFRLSGLRGRRAARARHHRPGQVVLLGNGRGETATAVVVAIFGARLDLTITGRQTVPAPPRRLAVVQGVEVAERDELAVAELAEAGADEIAALAPPAVADRWWRRDPAPYWRRVARDASERSGRVWLPRIGAVYRSVLHRFEWGAQGFVLDSNAAVTLAAVDMPAAGELLLVVGSASSGLDAKEVAALVAAGAVPARYSMPAMTMRECDTAIAATATLAARLAEPEGGG